MPRWRKIVSLLLLSLWLPAVMHCQLEAAGVLPESCGHEDTGRSDSDSCADDGCGSIEEGGVKPSGGTSKMAAPLLAATGFILFSADGLRGSSHAAVSVAATVVARARDWVPFWCFARRAALPARAPSLVG